MTSTSSTYVDAAFPARGELIPLDHGYALFSALSHAMPGLHERARWGIHPIRGHRQGPGKLALTRYSQVKLRVPKDEVGHTIDLAHKTIALNGHEVYLGAPRLFPLIPAPHLKARFVTIKGFFDDSDAFIGALKRQLAALPGLSQDPERVEIQLGPRRVLRAKNHTVVGWAVALTGLGAHASIAIQRSGLGGRRHLGAGMFVPPPRSA